MQWCHNKWSVVNEFRLHMKHLASWVLLAIITALSTLTVQKYPSLPFYEHAFENFKNPYLNKFLVNLRDLFFILFVWAVCICGSGAQPEFRADHYLKRKFARNTIILNRPNKQPVPQNWVHCRASMHYENVFSKCQASYWKGVGTIWEACTRMRYYRNIFV